MMPFHLGSVHFFSRSDISFTITAEYKSMVETMFDTKLEQVI